ncbi:MAG: hypothetical protein AAFV90_24270 [Cyanobacteria bacterium J06634_5]
MVFILIELALFASGEHFPLPNVFNFSRAIAPPPVSVVIVRSLLTAIDLI